MTTTWKASVPTYEVRFDDEEEWSTLDGFDAEDAAADFVEAAFNKGAWAGEGLPKTVDVVTRVAGSTAIVQVTVHIDWSPSFVGRAR